MYLTQKQKSKNTRFKTITTYKTLTPEMLLDIQVAEERKAPNVCVTIGVMKVTVTDVIIIVDNKLLLVQERKEVAHGLWNFPGGKVEAGETPEQAAYREIKEELNVELVDAKFFKTYPHQIPGFELDLMVFIGQIKGDIKVKDDEIMSHGWFTLKEIEAMKDQLRGAIILDQARDAIYSKTKLNSLNR